MAINKVFYRSPHNYDVEEASNEASVKDFGPSLTVQSLSEEVDLNVIMKRFGITGQMPPEFRMPEPHEFGEVPQIDFRQAQDYVIAAREAFDTLPAEVRAKFENNPAGLLDFLADSRNRDEAIRLGLVPEPRPAPATPAASAEPTAAAVPAPSGT